eukprot:12505075-Alexandrium_andersonii.AAC.1
MFFHPTDGVAVWHQKRHSSLWPLVRSWVGHRRHNACPRERCHPLSKRHSIPVGLLQGNHVPSRE